jgi:hypothetical protein
MTNKKKLALILSPIILLCLLCAAPWAYIAYRDNQEYQANVERLYAIAEKLGYTEENHINFYHIDVSGIDYSEKSVTLIFYSTESIEQFSFKVDELHLIESFHYENYQGAASIFLDVFLNNKHSEKIFSLSNAHSRSDFHIVNRPPPILTYWDLNDIEGQNQQLYIYNAQKPKADDVWLLGNETIPGNIVVIKLSD